MHRVTLADSGESFEVPPGQRILAAARRAGFWLPFECGWGSCGSCKATLVEGETELLFAAAPAVHERDERRGRILLCQSTLRSDATIKPLRVENEPTPLRPTVDVSARLARIEQLGPGIHRFTFELFDAHGEPATAVYRPGQYALLELAPGLTRCYSMSGLSGRAQVEFIAKHYPDRPGSTRLFDLAVGAVIPIELPYGDMWLREDDDPILLIAGGTGISAILALARSLLDDSENTRPAHIFYGATTRADLVCWDELTDLARRRRNTHLHGALVTPDDAWPGTTGLVTDALREVLVDNPVASNLTSARAYLAGPPPMTNAVRALLNSLEWPLDRIHVDSFG